MFSHQKDAGVGARPAPCTDEVVKVVRALEDVGYVCKNHDPLLLPPCGAVAHSMICAVAVPTGVEPIRGQKRSSEGATFRRSKNDRNDD